MMRLIMNSGSVDELGAVRKATSNGVTAAVKTSATIAVKSQ